MKILGIDPSTVSTGYAVVTPCENRVMEYGSIVMKPEVDISDRLAKISDTIEPFFKKDIDCVAVETPFLKDNVSTLVKLSMIQGVLRRLASKYNKRYVEISPKKAKKALGLSGASSKKIVNAMCRSITNLDHVTLDESDAIAVTYAANNILRLENIL